MSEAFLENKVADSNLHCSSPVNNTYNVLVEMACPPQTCLFLSTHEKLNIDIIKHAWKNILGCDHLPQQKGKYRNVQEEQTKVELGDGW